jgi:large subunit ribosomal protein L4e
LTKAVSLFDLEGKSIGKVELPEFFETPLRPDLIRRAVVALHSHTFQPQGRDPMAGKRNTAQSIGVGHGMSRIPRIKGDRYPKANQAAFAPGTVKGRLLFPPTPNKRVAKKMNKKEYRNAFLSALAATSSKELVKARGHRVAEDQEFPLIVSDDLERMTKSSEAQGLLKKIRVWDDVERASIRKIRSGKGSTRGRPYKHPVSALVVVEKRQGAERAFGNLTGVKVVDAASLNVDDLAPGTHPGRLTIWSESALKAVGARLGGSLP